MKKHSIMLKQRHERERIISVLSRKLPMQEGILLAKKLVLRDNDFMEASHKKKMMVQVQCGQVSRLPPVRILF